MVLLTLIFFVVYPPKKVTSQDVENIPQEVSPSDTKVINPSLETKPFDSIVKKYSQEYGVPYNIIDSVITCENTTRDPKKQSGIKYTQSQVENHPEWGVSVGEYERSFGLAQIHLPDNKNVTYEQATDPDFSIRYMASEMSKGRYTKWSCYTKLKNKGII